MKISIPVVVVVAILMLLSRGHGRAQLATNIPTASPQPTARPTPRPAVLTRTFHCDCAASGQPVVWAGNVQASSYFQARRVAAGQCLAYLGVKPLSPLIATPAAAQALSAVPTVAPLPINLCANCACN